MLSIVFTPSKFNLIVLSSIRLILHKLLQMFSTGPHLNISCISSFKKPWIIYLVWKAQRKHIWAWVLSYSFTFLNSKVPFCGIRCPFHLSDIVITFLLVRITFLPWHTTPSCKCLKLFFIIGCHVYQTFIMSLPFQTE